VPETEGTTCTSCFTLNPPGAPACIRCNQPLPETAPGTPPAETSPVDTRPAAGPASATAWPGAPAETGARTADLRGAAGSTGNSGFVPGEYSFPAPAPTPRGLAVPPKGTPGESRTGAAAVQPPGYGMGPVDTDAGPIMSPAEQRRISRRIAIVGAIIVLVALAGGGAAIWLTRTKYLDVDPVASGIGTALTEKAGETVTVRCQGTPKLKAGETFTCTATDRHGVTRSVRVTVLDTSGRYEWTLS
jgi:hypothetical protein